MAPFKAGGDFLEKANHALIEGDNLPVLKILQKNYSGKIKMIYIDPPYNTGNDSFIYPDNYKQNRQKYDQDAGLRDEAGNRTFQDNFKKNTKENGHYHSAWLSMMYPRLFLARNLLREDGVIFISIDDNEQANLKLLCDEIFGEENFVENFYLQVRYANKSLNEKDDFQKLLEKVFIYAKDKKKFSPHKPFENYDLSKFYNEVIEKSEGKEIILGDKKVRIFYPEEFEIVKHAEGKIGLLKDTWASGSVLTGNTSGKFFDRYLADRKEVDGIGCLYKVEGIGEDGLGYRYFTGPKKENATKGQFYSGVPLQRIKELSSGEARKYKPIINFYNMSGDFGNIRHEGGVDFRSGKKPVKLLKYLLKIASDKDSLILDFFAGSGTLAHAVMALNAEDGGQRRSISIQLPEEIDEKHESYKAGYRVISDITRDRISKVIEKLSQEKGASENLTCANYVLTNSHFAQWRGDIDNQKDLAEQLDLLADDKADISHPLNLISEIVLKAGYGLLGVDALLHEEPLGNEAVLYCIKVRENPQKIPELYICLADYHPDILQKLKQIKHSLPEDAPSPCFVVLDAAFTGEKKDELLANLKISLEDIGMELEIL